MRMRDLSVLVRQLPLTPLVPPPEAPFHRTPLSDDQGYLKAAPEGVGIIAAWSLPGGQGEGCRCALIEQGWNLAHDSFEGLEVEEKFGLNQGFRHHGANTLGVIAARDNGRGTLGIAHRIERVLLSSEDIGIGTAETANALAACLGSLQPGDVILIQSQLPRLGALLPVLINDLIFEIIRLATALGLTVVVPAGNSGRSVDNLTTLLGRTGALDRQVRDSGAVLVGAADPVAPSGRIGFSNFGTSVDCFAWGRGVVTPGGDAANSLNGAFNFDFSGTSAAAAIIAGVALCLQGIAKRSQGGPLHPLEVRALLSDPRYGTPSGDPQADRIGVMPNLEAMLEDRALRDRLDLA